MRKSKNTKLLVGSLLTALLVWNAAAQFTFTHIGGGATGTLVTNSPGSYTLDGGGDDIWSGGDNFDFAHYPVTGDLDMRVRVESMEPTAAWSKAGLMVREYQISASRMAFTRSAPPAVPTIADAARNGVNDVAFMYRTGTTSGPQGEHEDGGILAGYPNAWIRLTRSGNTFAGYHSNDGTNWTQRGGSQDSATWEGGAMPATLQFGLAVSRHSGSDPTCLTEFREFSPTPITLGSSPASLTVSVSQGATFTAAPGATFGAFAAYQWIENGSNILSGANSASYTKPNCQLAHDYSTYSCLISNRLNGSTVMTDAATLNVVDSPQVQSVTTSGDPGHIYVTFTKQMDPSTTEGTSWYQIDNGITVTQAVFHGGASNVVQLSVSPVLSPVTLYSLTISGPTDTDFNFLLPDPAVRTLRLNDGYNGPAAITMKRFEGINGGVINDLVNNPNFPCNPSFTEGRTEFEIPPGIMENYGAQLFGVFIAPVSGDYRFYMSSDDNGVVYLSSDANPANKVAIASEPQWNGVREFGSGSNQGSRGNPASNISALKALVAGQAYYVEGLMKEGGGGDNLAVAVEYPGSTAVANGSAPIPASLFSPRYSVGCPPRQFFANFGPVAVANPPANQTAIEMNTATFSVDLDGTAPWTMQWYKNGSALAGKTNLSCSLTATVLDNGAAFHLIANNAFGSATSSVATLTVIPAPQLVSANSHFDADSHIYVKFTKIVNDTATNVANYTVSAGVTVTDATYLYTDTIRLTVSAPLTFGSSYTVTVSGVQDADGNVMNPSPASSTFTHMPSVNAPQGLTFKRYSGIGGGAISDLTGNAIFPCSPTTTDLAIATMEFPGGGDALNDYGAWIYGVFVPPTSGAYRFATSSDDSSSVYLSSDASPANKTLISAQGGWNGYREYGGRESAPVNLVAGNRYYLEVLMKEGGGGDHVSVAVQKPGDPAIANGQTAIPRALFADSYSVGCPPTAFFSLGALSLLAQPADVTVAETTVLKWGSSVNGSPNYSYTWYSNGVVVGTSPTFTIRALRYANGATFGLTISNGFSGVAASNWVLTVISDEVAPILTRAAGSGTFDKVTVSFNEPMDAATAVVAGNYSITSSSGGVLAITGAAQRDPTNVVLTTAAQTRDEVYTVVVNNVADRSGIPNPIAANSTVSFTGWHYSPGFAKMETFATGSGGAIGVLTAHPTYPHYPRDRSFITSPDSRLVYPDDSHDNYGGRLSGLFVPPTNGNYIVYVMNDDDGLIRASTNDNANFAQPIYSSGCCNGPAPNTTRPTPALALAGGSSYYYEGLWMEGGGGDYLRLSLDGINTIPASMLAIYANPDDTILNVSALTSATNTPNNYVSFTVTANNSANFPMNFQWQRWDGASYTNIPGATSLSLAVGPLAFEDEGAQVRIVVNTPGRTATSGADIHVIADTVGPRLLSARVDGSFSAIYLTFSEAVDVGTATDILSYTVMDTNGGVLEFFDPHIQTSPSNITMRVNSTTPLIEGMTYVVDASGVSDANSQPIDFGFSTANVTAWIRNRGFVRHDFYTGIGGTTIANLIAAGSYPNSPNITYYTNTTDFPQSVPDLNDYGLRMSGYFIPTNSGVHTFALKYDDDTDFKLSTDDNAANLVQLLALGCCNGNFNGAATATLVAGKRYYFEARIKEGGGGDYLTIGVQPPGGVMGPINSTYLEAAIDPTIQSAMPVITGIETQPASVTSYSPDNAVFSVGVTNGGTGANWFQWQVNVGGTNAWSDIPFANASSYTLSSPCPSQSGNQYRAYYVAVAGRSHLSSAATLTVFDTNAPVANCPAPISAYTSDLGGRTVSFNATATDACDPLPTVLCSPASGSLFTIGVSTVTCLAWDISNNTNVCSFDVTVVLDTNGPVVTCSTNISVEATGAAGESISYDSSAADSGSGLASVTCTPASGSVFAVGNTTVTCTAVDNVNNTNTCSFTVSVTDTTAPSITCPGNQAGQCNGTNGFQATFSATATDLVDGAVTVVCTPASGSYFPLGTNLVLCVAVDAHNNSTTCAFLVTVTDPVIPVLTVARSGTNVVVSWPASCTTYTLKGTAATVPATWSTVPEAVVLNGGNFEVTIPATGAARYYRLDSRVQIQ